MTPAVDRYVDEAPEAMRPALQEIRALIRRHLPGLEEKICENGFAVYTDRAGDWVAGFAWRKKGPMLYVMAPGVFDRYDDRLGPLRTGRSCVEWRADRSMSLDQLRKLAAEMLANAVGTPDSAGADG